MREVARNLEPCVLLRREWLQELTWWEMGRLQGQRVREELGQKAWR